MEGFKVEVDLAVFSSGKNAQVLQDLEGRFTKVGTTVEEVYKFKSREFLDKAADELYRIPSEERYRAWHSGNRSFRKFRRSKMGLAAAIVDERNIEVEKSPGEIRYRVFRTAYMDSVAKHWAAIEYGTSSNITAAAQRKINFLEPGGSKFQSARSSPPFQGIGRLQGKTPKRQLRSQKSQKGLVKRPIRKGAYMERAYYATIGPQLEAELRRRITRSLGFA